MCTPRNLLSNLALLGAATLASSAVAFAHPTWFSGAVVKKGEHLEVNLQLTTTDTFPIWGQAQAPNTLELANLQTKTGRTALLFRSMTKEYLGLRGFAGADTAVQGIAQTKAQLIELDPEIVARYLIELGNPSDVKARYLTQKTWRELYRKNAKVWVRLRLGKPASALLKPSNLPFEFVPQIDPLSVAVGARIGVCAFAQGQPVAHAHLILTNSRQEHTALVANAQGCTQFRRPSGAYLLHGIHIQASEKSGLDWESQFASFTVIDALQNSTAKPEGATKE